ncbi:protease [Paenibacillus thalictri]|uniref:Protease n=1 Tax=Paenibacillus thalictri TaxID=2527873 RepID=A0A4V2J351_9BACL|nr:protease [Paenibacillus thalictri]TBL69802.1 protease [Paenibacillus thalictri]
MLELYWSCLAVGALVAVATVLFGDVLSNALHGMLDFMSGDHLHVMQPMVLFGGITVFGGAGILLSRYSVFTAVPVVLLSAASAIAVSSLVYFLYVKPMRGSESSIGFSLNDLVGQIGEISVPVPAQGCGEVIFILGSTRTNQIAASFDGDEIESGARVVTVEVKDHVVYVTRFEQHA